MMRKPAADTANLIAETSSPSPEQMKSKEMFNRVMIVAELLMKSAERPVRSCHPVGNVPQKTQE